MSAALFLATAVAYAVASALLLAYLAGASTVASPWGARAALVGAALHVAHEIVHWRVDHVSPMGGIAPTLSAIALMVVAAFLLLRRGRARFDVIGAIVMPIALSMFALSRAHGSGVLPGGPVFIVHIASNVIGVAFFTVACGLAIAYLLQERNVKARELGGLFRRLPPLETLDQQTYRLLAAGVPPFTLGVVTGHVVAVRTGPNAAGLPLQQYLALVAWVIFASVLLLRVLAGWRGRRAAIGTILGYGAALMVLLFYVVRGRSA